MKHINPEVFRAAAEVVASDRWYACPAITLSCNRRRYGEVTIGMHRNFFKNLFRPDSAEAGEPWWDGSYCICHDGDTPRIIALELAALIAEEEASDV